MTAQPISSGMTIDGNTLVLNTGNNVAAGGQLPVWNKFTIPYTSLQTAGLTNTVPVVTLQPHQIVQGAFQNVTTAFSGGTIATIVDTVGISGTVAKYLASTTLASIALGSGLSLATNLPESMTSTTVINLYATSTIGLLSALTQGSVDIYLLIATVP